MCWTHQSYLKLGSPPLGGINTDPAAWSLPNVFLMVQLFLADFFFYSGISRCQILARCSKSAAWGMVAHASGHALYVHSIHWMSPQLCGKMIYNHVIKDCCIMHMQGKSSSYFLYPPIISFFQYWVYTTVWFLWPRPSLQYAHRLYRSIDILWSVFLIFTFI